MPPTDPLIYRFYELVMVNGPALKALIEEEFGDGIMSAIDFDMLMERQPDPKGDRVKLTMSGKFLPYKYYGATGNAQAYGLQGRIDAAVTNARGGSGDGNDRRSSTTPRPTGGPQNGLPKTPPITPPATAPIGPATRRPVPAPARGTDPVGARA